jgi:hypothetical protein
MSALEKADVQADFGGTARSETFATLLREAKLLQTRHLSFATVANKAMKFSRRELPMAQDN